MAKLFLDSDGSWSWRKAGTALVFIIFAFACVGYCINHNFEELPKSYTGVIGMVFTFYFFRNLKIGSLIKKKRDE